MTSNCCEKVFLALNKKKTKIEKPNLVLVDVFWTRLDLRIKMNEKNRKTKKEKEKTNVSIISRLFIIS